jgi:hypothetical protein
MVSWDGRKTRTFEDRSTPIENSRPGSRTFDEHSNTHHAVGAVDRRLVLPMLSVH